MHPTRRRVLQGVAAVTATAVAPPLRARAQAASPARKAIPSSGEAIPVIGLGTWITFNVGDDPVLRDECADVMAAFFAAGGRVIDSSPMYGSSQDVIGYALERIGTPEDLVAADKVWTSSGARGPAQIEQSRRRWGIARFDLMQVHNLLAWQDHLDTLFEMKATGQLRHVGITTSENRRHGLFEEIMRSQPLDFIQVTYNVVDRAVENRILPLARERAMAVMVNRPFQQGALIRRLRGKPLPEWASEIGAESWAQFILKFIISHPDVTVTIPATTRVDHVRENVAAGAGPLPDAAMRQRMAATIREL
jgi:diketogulonate reductase-like aldo/keto reductase